MIGLCFGDMTTLHEDDSEDEGEGSNIALESTPAFLYNAPASRPQEDCKRTIS